MSIKSVKKYRKDLVDSFFFCIFLQNACILGKNKVKLKGLSCIKNSII